MVHQSKRVFIFLFLCTLFGVSSYFLHIKNEVRATSVSEYTVCPIAGTGCDYVGGDGIQQAIDAAPIGSINAMTTINLKAGAYSRQVFNTVTYDDTYGFKGKFFLDTKDKYIILKGENNTTLDGEHSVPMNAIITKNGNVVIDSLIISGFREEPRDTICRQWLTACSDGNAIFAGGAAGIIIKNNRLMNNGQGIVQNNHSNTTIISNQITGNAVGININGQANTLIKNNLITNQWSEGIFISGDVTAVVMNNTLFKNAFIGLHLASTGDPILDVRNNIITDNAGNVSNPGVGIWQYNPGASNHPHSIISNNLVARNAAEVSTCSLNGVCTGTGFIFNQDPKYVNIDTGDFHLQSGSPAKGTGDTAIKNPDNTTSDMGAYGGPGACGWDNSLPGCVAPLTSTPVPSIACTQRSHGDANCDGVTNELDYSVFKSALQGAEICTNCSADFNNDGKVNLIDYEIWRNTVYN